VSKRVPRDFWVTMIGVGKMLKTATLAALGLLAFFMVHHDLTQALRHWIAVLGLAPGGHWVRLALAEAGVLSDRQLREIGLVCFLYAGLFAIEGAGLLLRRRWGEWVSIIITGSFIPIEIYETFRNPHVGRALGTLVNIAAVAYLVVRVRQRRRAEAS
jgi:uncharacterized membrane protein (DUF2068 family)